jgi:hypothetical protein
LISGKQFQASGTPEFSLIAALTEIAFQGSPVLNAYEDVLGVFVKYNIPSNAQEGIYLTTGHVLT